VEYEDKVHAEIHIDPKPVRLGATVKVSATFYDEDGYEEDPDSGTATVTITDNDGTAQVTTGSMTEDSETISTYFYLLDIGTSDSAGKWKAKVNADYTDDDGTTRKIVEVKYFDVEVA
jgi:hypothetical protein